MPDNIKQTVKELAKQVKFLAYAIVAFILLLCTYLLTQKVVFDKIQSEHTNQHTHLLSNVVLIVIILSFLLLPAYYLVKAAKAMFSYIATDEIMYLQRAIIVKKELYRYLTIVFMVFSIYFAFLIVMQL